MEAKHSLFDKVHKFCPCSPLPVSRAAARPAFAVWANEEELHAEWELIEWFVATGLTQLLRVFSMVYPSESSEMLRHAFCETMRHTCLAFGAPLAAPCGQSSPAHDAASIPRCGGRYVCLSICGLSLTMGA